MTCRLSLDAAPAGAAHAAGRPQPEPEAVALVASAAPQGYQSGGRGDTVHQTHVAAGAVQRHPAAAALDDT